MHWSLLSSSSRVLLGCWMENEQAQTERVTSPVHGNTSLLNDNGHGEKGPNVRVGRPSFCRKPVELIAVPSKRKQELINEKVRVLINTEQRHPHNKTTRKDLLLTCCFSIDYVLRQSSKLFQLDVIHIYREN